MVVMTSRSGAETKQMVRHVTDMKTKQVTGLIPGTFLKPGGILETASGSSFLSLSPHSLTCCALRLPCLCLPFPLLTHSFSLPFPSPSLSWLLPLLTLALHFDTCLPMPCICSLHMHTPHTCTHGMHMHMPDTLTTPASKKRKMEEQTVETGIGQWISQSGTVEWMDGWRQIIMWNAQA